jgi:hypothetical protein
MYESEQDIRDGESVFNELFICPFIRLVALGAKNNNQRSKCDFKPGETFLTSMTKQLIQIGQHKNDSSQYRADGLVKFMD